MDICFIVLFSILFLNIFLFGPKNKCLLLTSRLFDTKSKTAAKKVTYFSKDCCHINSSYLDLIVVMESN